MLPKGTGSIFSFDIKGGREAGRRFIERLKLFSHLANVGDAKSLVIHPASTTHAQLDAAALKQAGIGEGMIRLSVGLEDPEDLIDDLGSGAARVAEGLTMNLTVDGRTVFATTGGTEFDAARPAIVFSMARASTARPGACRRAGLPIMAAACSLSISRHTAGPKGQPSTASPAMADWTAKLIEAAGLKQAALVGHSMGALVALDCAARHPEKVRALGLCGVAVDMPVHPEMLESAKANTLKVQELMTFWGMGNALHKGGMVSPGLWLRRESLAVLAGNEPGVIHTDLAACNAYKDAPQRARGCEGADRIGAGRRRSHDAGSQGQGSGRCHRGVEGSRHPELRALHDGRATGRNAGGSEGACLERVALVTGSTSGIGEAIARRLSRDG